MNKKVIAVLAVTIALLTLAATRRRAALPPADPLSLNLTRSFAVTDLAILQGFPFTRVVDQIASRSGIAGASGAQLIRQMYDTQSAKPGLADPDGPHCDDFLLDGAPSFNGFPRRCPTPEARLAATPFGVNDYKPVALINRFDMAPADGANCGQYRMIYVTYQGTPPSNHRIHLIFEAVLPNPHRDQGIAGCRPVAQFWADLTKVDSMSERRARLEQFFFDGIPGFEPAVHPDHYTLLSGGGVRMRENVDGTPVRGPRFYQFRIERQCSSYTDCALRLVPDVLENLPYGPMFDATVDTPTARAFRANFIQQVQTLAINDVNQYRMNVGREFLIGESDPTDELFAFMYDVPFARSQSSDAGKAFRAQIDAELKRIGSTLTPENIIARAESQTCVACHFVSGPVGGGVEFPSAIGFEHVEDLSITDGEGGPASRFQISPAMQNVFVPNRARILREFLQNGKPPEHSN